MIGLGALKFFLLKVDPKKRMLFDPDRSIQLQKVMLAHLFSTRMLAVARLFAMQSR